MKLQTAKNNPYLKQVKATYSVGAYKHTKMVLNAKGQAAAEADLQNWLTTGYFREMI